MSPYSKIIDELDKRGVTYKVHFHEKQSIPINNPLDFATALDYPIERILKTLFLSSTQQDKNFLAVCSINAKVDFKSLALIFGAGKIQVATREELQQKLRYPPNGVSPVGIDDYPIAIDNLVANYETVLIGAGVPGVEVEIAPADLITVTSGIMGNFALIKDNL